MSVEHYKSEEKDFFDNMEDKKRKIVNEDTIKDIEDKLKESKEESESVVEVPDDKETEEEVEEESDDDDEEETEEEVEKEIEEKDTKEIISEAKENLTKQEIDLHKELEKDIGKIEAEKPKKEIKKEEPKKPEVPEIKPKLKFLEDPEDEDIVYIGRKKSVLKQYGKMGSAYIGKVAEKDCKNKKVHLDGLNPHVVFLDGARGTGKSYLLGVIAEQLAKTNPYIGQIVIDPVGVFWSMKFPNRDKKELQILKEWGLKPEGLKNLKVFVPEGIQDQLSKETFDDTFSMYASLLTTEDWCLTFGIERFSPSGLLLEKTLDFVKKGYTSGGTKDYPETENIKAKGNQYTLEDIINCLQKNAEFSSAQKGYKPDSIRALVSRFEAAKAWGVFSDHGTPLSRLSRENQLTVLDTSFLDENITALVIGILARRILAARKLLARQDAVKQFRDKETNPEHMLEIEVPPTWLYIDEAHTLIPSGNTQTPATAGIIEYVKQGRRPGCSLVFATQQPSAINTKVLSQVDVLISNKLVFNDDIHAIQKRMPAIIPKQYKEPNFIKTLPFATALCGERSEETSRAFILRAAPRTSQHEGRDAETIREIPKKSKTEVLNLATNMIYKKLDKSKEMKVNYAKDILDVVNIKYRAQVLWDDVLEKLFEKDVILDNDLLYINEEEIEKVHSKVKAEIKKIESDSDEIESEEEEESLEGIEEELDEQKIPPTRVKMHSTLPLRVNRYKVEDITKSNIPRSLPFFKPKEVIQNIILKHRTLYKIDYNLYDKQDSFKRMHCYVDSVTGEFIHFRGSDFKESKGLSLVGNLEEHDLEILYVLKKQQTLFNLARELDMDEKDIEAQYINKFKEMEIIDIVIKNNREVYKLSKNFDIPFNAQHKLLNSLDELPLKKEETEFVEQVVHPPAQIQEFLNKLWGDLEFVSLEEMFWPIWYVSLIDKHNNERILKIDGVVGQMI